MAEVWAENRAIFKAMITDALLFLCTLVILAFCYSVLRLLKWLGYPQDRVALMETVHYWAYVSVDFLFIIDLFYKLLCFLFFRRSHGRVSV